MNDIDGTLLTDFDLKNINVDLDLYSDPMYARIEGAFNNFRFYGANVNKQGSVYVDPREVRKDDSDSFDDIKRSLGDNIFRQFKQVGSTIFFEELQLKIADSGMFFMGAMFDPIYLGRP
jgi:hypothetical protein